MAASGSTGGILGPAENRGRGSHTNLTNNQALFPAYSLTFIACRPQVSCADLPQRSLWLKLCCIVHYGEQKTFPLHLPTVNKHICTYLTANHPSIHKSSKMHL